MAWLQKRIYSYTISKLSFIFIQVMHGHHWRNRISVVLRGSYWKMACGRVHERQSRTQGSECKGFHWQVIPGRELGRGGEGSQSQEGALMNRAMLCVQLELNLTGQPWGMKWTHPKEGVGIFLFQSPSIVCLKVTGRRGEGAGVTPLAILSRPNAGWVQPERALRWKVQGLAELNHQHMQEKGGWEVGGTWAGAGTQLCPALIFLPHNPPTRGSPSQGLSFSAVCLYIPNYILILPFINL